MESSDPIFLFLKKMRLDKHYSKFISNPHFKIKSLEDCKRLLSNLNYLEDIGLSPAEVNRFKRLFENALKDSEEEYEGRMRAVLETQENTQLTERNAEPDPQVNQKKRNLLPIEKNPIVITYKCLNKENIKVAEIRKLKINPSVWSSLRYFKLVNELFKKIQKLYSMSECSSVEIYHRNGYPMVTSPSDYFKLVHEFDEDNFIFIFILPKTLRIINRSYTSTSTSSIEYIPITHKESRSEHTVVVLVILTNVYVEDLKYECSSQFHLPSSLLSIDLEYPDGTMEYNLSDNVGINIVNIKNLDYRLYLTVSEHYWEPNYLNAFRFDNYIPTIKLSEETLIYLNVHLLFLVQHVHSKGSLNAIKENLSLLRRISCSPPLIHSLWLLFMQRPITLPHKIAIVEGLITTVNLLDVSTRWKEHFNFPCLWVYLERNTKTSYIPDECGEIFQLERNTRLIKESDILNNQEYPYNQHDYHYFMEEFSKSKSCLFTFLHPLQLYRNYLLNRQCNGLTRILHNDMMMPCVLSSCTSDPNSPILECYSPYHGETKSFNPFKVDTFDSDQYECQKHSRIFNTCISEKEDHAHYSTINCPRFLVCPLTNELFHNPVTSPYGNTFERSAILHHLRNSPTDPISGQPLTEENLFYNNAIADCVVKYRR